MGITLQRTYPHMIHYVYMTYGYHFHTDGTIKKEKEYLSYSAIDCWKKSKDEYRTRYYHGAPAFTSPFTIFGNKVHKMAEDGELEIVGHNKEYQHEIKIETDIDGVNILGYIDMYHPDTHSITDLKTSVNPWTQVMVQKLDQLTLYQILVKKMHRKVDKKASLVWLETKWEDGHLALTGKQQLFTRIIERWERDNLRDTIVAVANEISTDFEQFKLSPTPSKTPIAKEWGA